MRPSSLPLGEEALGDPLAHHTSSLIYTYTYTYIYMYIYMYIHIRAYIYIYMYSHMHVTIQRVSIRKRTIVVASCYWVVRFSYLSRIAFIGFPGT